MNSHPWWGNGTAVLWLLLLASTLDEGVFAFSISPLGLGLCSPRIRSVLPFLQLQQAANSFEYNAAAAAADDPSLADFSSPYFWEGFYKQQLLSTTTNSQDNQTLLNDTSATTRKNIEFVYEWHESIPLSDLADLIPPQSRCLMVGCGNSRLPQVVLDRQDDIHMTLLDTSRICVEQLQVQYSHAKEQVSCVCASATEMASYFLKAQQQNVGEDYTVSNHNDNESPKLFDIIVDKGLVDAFMCGDGWETSVEALLRESTRILDCQQRTDGAIYLLVSYKLSPTVQATFQQLSDKVSGDSYYWDWDFDIEPLSNHRVSVSIATVRSMID